MGFNVRQKQTDAVLKMLNLNQPLQNGKEMAEVYKVLVLDKYCQDIIAPLLRVNELRKHGVTLHLLIENERQIIADVPAIYFIRPTQANVERVIQDASRQLYETIHVNFVSSASRTTLEQLAAGVVSANSLERFSKVYDQYLSFIALEPNLFSLGLPNAYVELNDPAARDEQIEVAEEVGVQVKKYEAAVDDITRRTAASDHTMDQEELMKQSTQNLMSAVSSLPELQEKKRTIDKHFKLALALLECIRGRALDKYYNFEEDLLTGRGDLAALVKLVQGEGAQGTPQDKLRLSLVYLLSEETLPAEQDLAELTDALLKAGCELPAFHYVKTLRRNNLIGSMKGGESALGASQGNLIKWAGTAFGPGFDTITKGIKNLMSGARQAPITSAVEALMDCKPGAPEFEGFAVFDPKAAPGRSTAQSVKGPFREAMVFVIGGGNYLERETISMWASRQVPAKTFVYGATEMLSGDQFLQQLAELGVRSHAH